MMYRSLVDTNLWKNEYLSVDPWKRLEEDLDEYKEYEDRDMILSGKYQKKILNKKICGLIILHSIDYMSPMK